MHSLKPFCRIGIGLAALASGSLGLAQSAELPASQRGAVAPFPSEYGPPDAADEVVVPRGVPPELAHGVARALNTYPSIRASQLAVDANDREIEAAKGLRWPTISVQGLSFVGGNAVGGDNLFAPNIVVDQPLWAGGRISAQIDRARVQRDVSAAELVETAEMLAIEVINAYYETVLAARRMAQLREGTYALGELSASIQRRVAQEVSPQSELILVNSRLADIRQQFNFAQANFMVSRELFRELTGLYDAEFDALPEYDAQTMHPADNKAIEHSSRCDPTVRRIQAEARLAQADTEVARKQLWPTVSAQFSQSEVTGTRAGLAVTMQLTNGLSQFRVIEAAEARQLQTVAEAGAAQRQSRVRLANDMVLNFSSRERIVTAKEAVAASQEVTASYRRQFIAGRRSWLELVNAVREEITADLSLVDAETAAMASAARTLVFTCRWSPAEEY